MIPLLTNLALLFLIVSNGCILVNHSEELRGSAPAHPAAFSQDDFTFNKPQKERMKNDFEFYYKSCSLVERKPFPTGAIWQCAAQ